ncbi:MAG: hypothetical protein AAGE52_24600 [Myxococcota bacterium]
MTIGRWPIVVRRTVDAFLAAPHSPVVGRFGYYARLSARDKRTYRKSDEYDSVELDHPKALRPIAISLGVALRAEDRVHVERISQRLVGDLCTMLNVPWPAVRVHAVRPSDDYGELHGLYVREEGRRPIIEEWMRTAARGQVVAHRTFVRTLMHEVCHHLDFELLDLEDSFHTQGFFQRESSLVRQLLPKQVREDVREEEEVEPVEVRQLTLKL